MISHFYIQYSWVWLAVLGKQWLLRVSLSLIYAGSRIECVMKIQGWGLRGMLILTVPGVSYSLWPVDCNPPGSFLHGILQARILEWGCHFLLPGIFLTQGLNPGSPALQADSWLSEPPAKPDITCLQVRQRSKVWKNQELVHEKFFQILQLTYKRDLCRLFQIWQQSSDITEVTHLKWCS